jgi:hypothetical protein
MIAIQIAACFASRPIGSPRRQMPALIRISQPSNATIVAVL